MREITYRVKGTTGDKLWFYITIPSFFAPGNAIWYEGHDWNTLGQSTGLKDKNDKPVYDGDIIRICHYEPWDDSDPEDKLEYSIHEVKWGELAWVINPTISEEYNDLGMIGEGWEDGHLWMEVIGNIYENGELLTA